MCGRYTLVKTGEVERRFQASQGTLDLEPRYNVAPGQELPVVVRHSPNSLEVMRWGLVPFWAKDPKIGYKMINARAEGIEQKPAFRKPFKTQRCLIPATGFYEWQKEGRNRQPIYFGLKNGDLFAFAGLYDINYDQAGNKLKTYTIITTTANEVVGPVHDRMPVILRPEDESTWLDPELEAPEVLLKLLAPFPPEILVEGGGYRVIRRRETYEDLVALEE